MPATSVRLLGENSRSFSSARLWQNCNVTARTAMHPPNGRHPLNFDDLAPGACSVEDAAG
jgi:hypothetical protein